jgi:hypothetical protein
MAAQAAQVMAAPAAVAGLRAAGAKIKSAIIRDGLKILDHIADLPERE